MLYELYFNPSSGRWRIRIITLYLLFFSWSRDTMLDDTKLPHEFSTYDQAAAHASSIGLPRAYALRDRSRDYSAWVRGDGCHGTN